MSKTTSNRIKEIDIARAFAIILVVIGHAVAYQCVNNYENINYDLVMIEHGITDSIIHHWFLRLSETIYLFHMPLFFAVSGAAFAVSMAKKDENNNYLRYPTLWSLVVDKGKRLVIPYVVITLFWDIPVKYLAGVYKGLSKKEVIQHGIEGQLLLRGNSYLWFLIALFGIFIVVYVLEKYTESTAVKIYLLVLLSFLRYAISNHFTYATMENSIYFYIGYLWYSHREQYNQKVREKRWLIPGMLVLLLFAEYIKNIKALAGWELFSKYLGIAAGVILFYAIALKIAESQRLEQRWIRTMTVYGMGIYLYAEPMNYLILRVFVHYFSPNALGSEVGGAFLFLLRTVGVTLLSIIIVKILKKTKIKYIY